MGSIFTSSFKGRSSDWTITIDKAGYGGGSTALDVDDTNIKLVFGDPFSYEFGDYVMPSYIRLRFYDPDSTMWDEFALSSTDEDDYTVTITDSGDRNEFKWMGFVNIATPRKHLAAGIHKQVVDLYCYDGLTRLRDKTSTQAEQDIHEHIKDYLIDLVGPSGALPDGTKFDIEYFFNYVAENSDFTGAKKYVQGMVLPANTFAGSIAEDEKPGGHHVLSAWQALQEIAEGFNLRVWHRVWTSAGTPTPPVWSVTHPWGIGESVNLTDATTTFDTSAGTFSDGALGVAATALTDDSLISADAGFVLFRRLDAVDVRSEVGMPPPVDRGGAVIPRVELQRDGEFTFWDGGSPDTAEYWSKDSTSPFDATAHNTEGGGSAIQIDAVSFTVKQGSLALKEGDRVFVQVVFDYWRVSTDEDLVYSLKCGTETMLSNTVTANTAFASKQTETNGPTEYIAGSSAGLITITFNHGNTNSGDPAFDDLSIRLFADEGGETPLTSWTHRTTNATVAGGEVATYVRHFDNYAKHDSATPTFAIMEDTGTDQLTYVEDGTGGTQYDSLTELANQHRIAMQTNDSLLIHGELFGLWPPTKAFTYSSNRYRVGAGVEMDLVREVTRGTWKQMLKTYS